MECWAFPAADFYVDIFLFEKSGFDIGPSKCPVGTNKLGCQY